LDRRPALDAPSGGDTPGALRRHHGCRSFEPRSESVGPHRAAADPVVSLLFGSWSALLSRVAGCTILGVILLVVAFAPVL